MLFLCNSILISNSRVFVLIKGTSAFDLIRFHPLIFWTILINIPLNSFPQFLSSEYHRRKIWCLSYSSLGVDSRWEEILRRGFMFTVLNHENRKGLFRPLLLEFMIQSLSLYKYLEYKIKDLSQNNMLGRGKVAHRGGIN